MRGEKDLLTWWLSVIKAAIIYRFCIFLFFLTVPPSLSFPLFESYLSHYNLKVKFTFISQILSILLLIFYSHLLFKSLYNKFKYFTLLYPLWLNIIYFYFSSCVRVCVPIFNYVISSTGVTRCSYPLQISTMPSTMLLYGGIQQYFLFYYWFKSLREISQTGRNVLELSPVNTNIFYLFHPFLKTKQSFNIWN